jgi:hypothetical protein
LVPIEVARNRENTVAVAHCFGKLTEADVKNAINFAFSSGLIEPSLDRIVTIDPTAELHELDSATLRRIQQCVVSQELRGNRAGRFRSVLVHSSPLQMQLLQLYKAIWDELALPGVEFFIASNLKEAWITLGRRPSPLQREST